MLSPRKSRRYACTEERGEGDNFVHTFSKVKKISFSVSNCLAIKIMISDGNFENGMFKGLEKKIVVGLDRLSSSEKDFVRGREGICRKQQTFYGEK